MRFLKDNLKSIEKIDKYAIVYLNKIIKISKLIIRFKRWSTGAGTVLPEKQAEYAYNAVAGYISYRLIAMNLRKLPNLP